MDINNSIFHKISKDRGSKSQITIRKTENTVSPEMENLIANIHNAYHSKSGKTYSAFDGSSNFKKYLQQHLNGRSDFQIFSNNVAVHFQDCIDKKSFATGGYLFIFRYKDEDDFIMAILLDQKHGSIINERTMEVKSIPHLNVERISYACQINVTKMNAREEKYLSFVSGNRMGANEISQYFQEFIGCDDLMTATESTKALQMALDDFCEANKIETGYRLALEKQIYQYCIANKADAISLEMISNIVKSETNNSELNFFEFANSNKYGLSEIFSISPTKMIGLCDLSVKSNGIKLSIPKEQVNRVVAIDGDVVKIKGLPKYFIDALKKQIDPA